jgi:Flp pilus assembly protein TadG
MEFLKNNRGATAVEFALVATPVLFLIIGIMQIGYLLWIDNLLHVSVDAAARCGAVNSATSPCFGNTLANRTGTANLVFQPSGVSATFMDNGTCSAGSIGLSGTYQMNILFFNVRLTAKSCYPRVS